MFAVVLGMTGGFAIAQIDPLNESVTTIQGLESDKDSILFELEAATAGFDTEIQTVTDAITISEQQKADAKAALIDKLAQHQVILDQINAILATP